MRVAAQGTGHAATALAEGSLHDTILVKTHRMRVVEIDPDSRRARAQAGAIWADVAGPASEHGLAALAGSSHDVGVVGYCLGGGVSWLARKHGLAANSVVAVQIVTADGRVVVADAHHEPDLFWAVRGGGGNFGIVTAIELELYPVDELYAGMLAFPVERAAEILRAWREWVRTVPDEATSVGRILHFPPFEEIPAPLRGQSFVIVEMAYLGDEAAASQLLAPLRALGPVMDTFAMVAPADLLALHMDPPRPRPRGRRRRAARRHARRGHRRARGRERPGHPAALGRAAPPRRRARAPRRGSGALATLEGDFALFAVGMAPHEDAAAAVEAHLDVVAGAVCEWDAGRRYLNFSERAVDTRTAYPAAAYRRLRAVKTLVDPDNLFRANHAIAPID